MFGLSPNHKLPLECDMVKALIFSNLARYYKFSESVFGVQKTQ